jgi:protein-L-isoaspartate(D-aspartate) O-methyltransferase
MSNLAEQRKFFAEEIQITSDIRTTELIHAFARVPREEFLGRGPWTIRGEADFQKPPRQTPGDDPRFVYHNVAIAIDEARTLFNGAPGFLAVLIDALGLNAGARVAHLGTGTGYYTAVMAETVGPDGRVAGVEVDPDLAARSAENLKSWPWARVVAGDGSTLPPGPFDAILINAGVTHVLPNWIHSLAPGGRMIVPLTATIGGPMGPAMANIGKGIIVLLTKTDDPLALDARLVTFVAIYSAVGLRDDAVNAKIGAALAKMPYPMLKKLRLDPHEPTASCWMHDEKGCWTTGS